MSDAVERARQALDSLTGPSLHWGISDAERVKVALRDLLAEIDAGYPQRDGDVIVIGPECFASADELVICWKGRNYYAPMGGSHTGEGPGGGVVTALDRAREALAEFDNAPHFLSSGVASALRDLLAEIDAAREATC